MKNYHQIMLRNLKLIVLFIISASSCFSQTSSNELKIKNENDFVNLIKSVVDKENLYSENLDSRKYIKTIKFSQISYIIELYTPKSNDINPISEYRGEIKAKYKINNSERESLKSRYHFYTYKENIAGRIEHWTNSLDTTSQYTLKSMTPNWYEAEFEFEAEEIIVTRKKNVKEKKENSGEDEDDESMNETNEELTENADYKPEVIKNDFLKDISKINTDSFNIEKKLTKTTIGKKSNGVAFMKRFNVNSAFRLKYLDKFWEGNGDSRLTNHGFKLTMNTGIDKDTLEYEKYSPLREGPIVKYRNENGEKLQIESGEYKNGKRVGDFTHYTINYTTKERTIEYKNHYSNQGILVKEIKYLTTRLNNPNTNKDTTLNYVSSIKNYSPELGKPNGLFERYMLPSKNSNINNSFDFLITPIVVETGMYSNGKKIGIWKLYHENKQLKDVENFDTGEKESYNESGEIIFKRNKLKQNHKIL